MRWNPDLFTPTTERVNEPVPPGDYEFTVTRAFERVSHSGNEMLEMELAVDVGREQPITVYERLVATPAAQWKIHQFCHCVGLDYGTGELMPDDVVGKAGKARFELGEPRQSGRSAGRRFLEVAFFHRRGRQMAEDDRMIRNEPPQEPRPARAARPRRDEQPVPDAHDHGDIPF